MIHQGQIYLAQLSPTFGHEQSGTRPVLILQNNTGNKSLNTTIILPVTSRVDLADKAGTWLVKKEDSGLKKDSLILLFQIKTIDKRRLMKKIGHLNLDEVNLIKNELNKLF